MLWAPLLIKGWGWTSSAFGRYSHVLGDLTAAAVVAKSEGEGIAA